MKRSTKIWVAVVIAIVLVTAAVTTVLLLNREQPVRNKKVILVIVDGIPADVIENATVPNMRKLGAYKRSYTGGEISGYSQTPTISAPGYMNVITGTWGNKHNVYDNSVDNPNYNYWNIFRLLKEQQPDRKIGIYSTWLDNRVKLIGEGLPMAGNITFDYKFDGYELDTIQYPHDAESLYIKLIDERVVNETATSIANDAPDLSWVYLQYTDDMGHMYGDSTEFYQSVADADLLIEQIVESVDHRIENWNEDWLVIITTDHGRSPETGYGHGGQSERERTTWIFTNLEQTNSYFDNYVPAAVDIFPTMARFMDIEIPTELLRELDGVPLMDKVSLAQPSLTLSENLLHITWKAIDNAGDVIVWLSLTNSFQDGTADDYQHIATVPVGSQQTTINITNHPSQFFKVVLEGQYNTVNKFIFIT
ncbi:uncharacterized protein LOC119080050 [Bradysia coprophila]|uniref:uncharacterized protein LOC119080050 n=1 Tax=Bradysia coprophila TaxID=38358 RepID=UPI00187D87B2|nr:uncharacterized protein LOC119080050 [Bradysia coprophila]